MVFTSKLANIRVERGVAIQEFLLTEAHGEADYLPCID